MVLRYLIWLFWFNGILVVANFVEYPKAYFAREYIRKDPDRNFITKWYWGFLHDGSDYGDDYFNPDRDSNFWVSYNWSLRNPIHNLYYSKSIKGKHENHSGWATVQEGRKDNGTAWRTLKTNDDNGEYAHKYGRWINTEKSILGKQRITFEIDGKKYFRWSGAKPVRLWGNLYYVLEYKFGFENVNWAIQFHPFLFKRYEGETIKYNKHVVDNR